LTFLNAQLLFAQGCVEHGSVSPDVLKELIDRWIKSKQAG
jgi:hypothetical protein